MKLLLKNWHRKKQQLCSIFFADELWLLKAKQFIKKFPYIAFPTQWAVEKHYACKINDNLTGVTPISIILKCSKINKIQFLQTLCLRSDGDINELILISRGTQLEPSTQLPPFWVSVWRCVCVCECVPVCFSQDKVNWGKIAFYSEEGTSVTARAKSTIAFKSTREK